MAQTQDEHLTTGQLSASLDKQLSPQEQAVFDAHIASCQQCQNKLADLRLTANLLHALPVEEVPRSFILPTSVSIAPDRTTRQSATITPIPSRQRTRNTALRRSIRIISTLAAVLALCFIISGIAPLIYSGTGNSASTSSSSGTFAPAHPNATTSGAHQPENTVPSIGSATTQSRTPTSTAQPTPGTHPSSNSGSGTITQPVLDLSQPGVRLSIGILVLSLSIIILILTRQRRVATP